jgi:nicotinate-nucleotide adenylyltransferase
MKIGIFAGTFDPVHNGHIEFARSAVEAGHLDRVIIVAEKEPYRKKPHASWDHRQAMIERATDSISQVDHDYGFAAQLAHQHTMKDMLQKAVGHYGKENEFYFLVGSDLFEHMHQWRDLVSHHEYGGFIVALRDDHTMQWLEERRAQVADVANKVTVIVNNHPHVSSSKIRQSAKNGEVSAEVSANVNEYMQTHKLYS